MIKEKHDKGPDSVKEEPGAGGSEKDCAPAISDVRIKKEDDGTGSSCAIKKEPARQVTKNGGVIGSTNTGSLHASNERKCDNDVDIGHGLPPKTEAVLEPELPSDAFSMGLPGATATGVPAHPPAPDGIQPLPSNVINKQSSNVEVQYMQQQSQIFVFSTMLANSGAEEVLQGHFPSIIAYHCAQPGTKKYLEKNPLKVNQFSRQNASHWFNNLNMMKTKGCARSPGLVPKGQPPIESFLGPDGLDDMVGLGDNDLPWDQKNNHHLEGLEGVSNGLPDVPDMDSCSPSLAGVQPSLQGVKVPDENLTPQQRQHREEQLATIRKMQQMLFPESQHGEGTDNPDLANAAAMMGGNQQGGSIHGPGVGLSAHLEWQKLQQQFHEDHNKVHRYKLEFKQNVE